MLPCSHVRVGVQPTNIEIGQSQEDPSKPAVSPAQGREAVNESRGRTRDEVGWLWG